MNLPRRASALLAVLIILFAVAGCRRKELPTTVQAQLPPREVDYPAARARIQQGDPGAKVGRVIAVLPEENMASIGDIDVRAFQRGASIQFLGADDQPVASGIVLSIVNDTLHVKYTPIGQGGRRPYVGDLAIRLASPAQ